MNRLSGAEAFVRMLQLHGVRHVFGLCGDTSLPLYDALCRLDHGITPHPDPRRALGRLHGRRLRARDRPGRRVRGAVAAAAPPTSCRAWSRPTNPRSRCSRSPPTSRSARAAATSLTELDQEALFRPLTKWNAGDRPRGPDPGRGARARSASMTTGRPGAAHIGLPFDVQQRPGRRGGGARRCRRSARIPRGASAPDPAAIAAAAEALLVRRAPAAHLRRRAGDRRRRGRACARSPSCSTRRSPPRSAARAASPRTIRWRSAWSAATAARPRPARVVDAGGPGPVRRLPRRLGHDRALAPPGAGQGRASCTSTSTRR